MDEIIVYYVVNYSLKMTGGKVAAQTAHATQLLMQDYLELAMHNRFPSRQNPKEFYSMYDEYWELFDDWLDSNYKKVILSANQSQWEYLKKSKQKHLIVVDMGLNEIKPNSETVMVFYPMEKSTVPKQIAKLQTYKCPANKEPTAEKSNSESTES